jgi:hypothetical protein
MIDPLPLLEPLLELHDNIRDAVVSATEQQELDNLSGVSRDGQGDLELTMHRDAYDGYRDIHTHTQSA